MKLPSINTLQPLGRFEPTSAANCVLNDFSEEAPMKLSSLIHSAHCAIHYVPVVFSIEPDRKNTTLREHTVHCKKDEKR